jgi:hypothetical protein
MRRLLLNKFTTVTCVLALGAAFVGQAAFAELDPDDARDTVASHESAVVVNRADLKPRLDVVPTHIDRARLHDDRSAARVLPAGFRRRRSGNSS